MGLVSLFVPLTAGLFWKKANTRGAIWAIITGLLTWLAASWIDLPVAPILPGLLASAAGMLAGSLFSVRLQRIDRTD